MKAPLVVPVALAVLLAGCFHADPADGGTVGTKPALASVAFASAPASAVAGTTIVVCWTVAGSGVLGHAAILSDVRSRIGEGPGAYVGTTYYPSNATGSSPVTLPADLCTGVRLPATPPAGGKVYLRAHAMDPARPPGLLSVEERAVTVLEAGRDVATSVALVSHPAKAEAGSSTVVCWRVEGKGNATSTAVHWDVVTRNASGATFQAYAKGTILPGNATTPASRYVMPATYCGALVVPANATRVFLRAHVVDVAGLPGRLSAKESAIDVVGSIGPVSITGSVPLVAPRGTNLTVCWRVEGTGPLTRAAVVTDNVSHAGNVTFAAYNGTTYFAGNATAPDPAGYRLPGSFCTNLRMPAAPGQIHFRAHAMHALDAPGRLSQEKSVLVV